MSATPAGSLRWQIRFDVGLWPDITVAVRMDAANRDALDYYLLASDRHDRPRLRLAEDNGVSLDAYRFETLDSLFGLAARTDSWRSHEQSSSEAQAVEMIPIERITVINPRVRNKKIFKEIVSNIAELGLKRPITVTRRKSATARATILSAAKAGWRPIKRSARPEIPALVVEADTEDCLVMSLVENLARRQHRASICCMTSRV